MRAVRLSALLFVALLASSRIARAQGDNQPEPRSRRWAIGFNPLAMAIGRYGGDLQRLLSPHHALLVNVHGDYASHDWQAIGYDRASPLWGFGAEAGWRFYPSSPSMRGFFLGVSLIAGWYNVDYYGRRFDLPGAGLAGDFGGQVELGADLFLAIGGGLQYLWTRRYPADIGSGVSWVLGAGLDPRLLLTVGALLR